MRLLDAIATSTATSGTVSTQHTDRKHFRLVQCDISAAATVIIQGRAASDLGWIDIHTFTSSGGESIAPWREMRATVSGNTGTVSVHLDI